ncbi:MAG: hypothetical protein PHZ19_10530 [Candidatus Thermoplasmatota archaeon]|nr:hypothetical protein [Candidatus Thermoplasmatota archaeon]
MSDLQYNKHVVDGIWLRMGNGEDGTFAEFGIVFYDDNNNGHPIARLEAFSYAWDAFAVLAPDLIRLVADNPCASPDMIEELMRELGFINVTENEPGVLEETIEQDGRVALGCGKGARYTMRREVE